MKRPSLLLAILILSSAAARADTGTVPAAEEAAAAPAAEEANRLAHVQNARTLDDFLNWATPAEIADDIGLEPETSALEDTATVGYEVQIEVHLNTHRVVMQAPGNPDFTAAALGGRPGHGTPTGCFKPIALDRQYWSRKYNAPMPNAVFFSPGVALHTGSLQVMSHGCVHLAASTSALIYETVAAHRNSTRICVSHD